MKNDKKRIDMLYSFFNAVRGNNSPNEYQSTLAVLKKLSDIHSEMTDEVSDDDLYEIMRDVADSFGVANPFSDRNRFIDIYRTLRGFEEVTWTDIMEYGDSRAKFRVPEALIDEMEKTLLMAFRKC